MLHAVAFYSAYFFFAIVMTVLAFRHGAKAQTVLFLAGISLVPIGKLFLLPISGLNSVGMSFIYTSLLSLIVMTLAVIRGVPRAIFLPMAFCAPVLLSLLFLSGTSQAWFLTPNSATGTSEIGVLRVASVLLVTLFSTYCAYYTMQTPVARRDIAAYYITGTLFATAIGAVIFYGVFIGEFNVQNLQPISRDVHIIDPRIYRFNPGANVNEFGQIIGYALLLLPWTGWKNWVKAIIIPVLLIADFLTLTRGAWLALLVAYVVLFLYSPVRTRAILGVTAITGIGLILIVAFTFDVLTPLLETRTAFSGGISGTDRLTSVAGALETLQGEPFRFLFGMGWAADLYGNAQGLGTSYIHNVPLMMLFDTGLVGIFLCLVIFAIFFRFIIARPAKDQAIPMALMAFMLSVSLTQHNFYHVQTWMIFGLILGDSLRAIGGQPRRTASLTRAVSAG